MAFNEIINIIFLDGGSPTLKNKIYKYMTSELKNVYIDKLDEIYRTCHRTIKVKHVDVKSNTYINSSKEINN